MNRLALGLLALLGAFFVWSSLYYWPYVVDDAYISLRYARNVVDGKGLVYNAGQVVEGYSNFLWVWIEAAVLWAELPPITAMKILGILSGLGVVFVTYALSGRWFKELELARFRTLVATTFIALHASLAIWSQSGLETVFYAMLVVGSVARHERELAQPRALPISAGLFALAWLTRPDAPIYGLYFILRRLAAVRTRGWARADFLWGAVALAVIVPYEIWGFSYYGRLLPMTHQAKVGDVRGLDLLVRQPLVWAFVSQQGLGFVGLLLVAAVGGVLGRRRLPLGAWLVALCGSIFVLYARTDWMPRHRFFVPILPFVGILIAYGAGELLRRTTGRRRVGLGMAALVAVCLVDYARVQTFEGQNKGKYSSGRLATTERGLWFAEVPARIAQLSDSPPMVEHLDLVPPDATICMRDIGLVGYYTMNPIWETAGLFTPTVAAALHDDRPETIEAMLEDLRRADPAYIYLKLLKDRKLTIDRRIHDWLQSDEAARAAYVKVTQDGLEGVGVTRILYMKRGLAPTKIGEEPAGH